MKGTLFVNEILEVRAGSSLEFLAAVVEERVPLMREYGHEPTGIYEVLSNPHEVVMVWATDIPSQMTWRANRDAAHGLGDEGEADERIVAWERRSAEFTRRRATARHDAAPSDRLRSRRLGGRDTGAVAGDVKGAERLAQRIVDEIADEDWPVGTILGTEPELTSRYGVSRNTFREAVRILEHLGAARMREGRGGGLAVTAPDRAR